MMEHSQWDVVILKPTAVFLSFLSAQLPDCELPDLQLLQTDNTAYALCKQDNDEKMVDELEKNYTAMFQHEIARWLGPIVYDPIEFSFLDFLRCFKFAVHSQIVLMEPSIDAGHQLLCVKPRSVWLKSFKSAVGNSTLLRRIVDDANESHLAENATVVIKNFKQLTDIKPFMQNYYEPVLKSELSRMCTDISSLPVVDDFYAFTRYFAVEIHSQLIHLH